MGSHFSPLCHRRQCQSQVHIGHNAENQKQKNHHLGAIFMFTSILFCASCEACQTTKRRAYEEATRVASSTTNPRPITVWNLDGLGQSIPGVILGDAVVPCGRLIQYYSRTLHALAPYTRTWLLRNHLKTFHHENRSYCTGALEHCTLADSAKLSYDLLFHYSMT